MSSYAMLQALTGVRYDAADPSYSPAFAQSFRAIARNLPHIYFDFLDVVYSIHNNVTRTSDPFLSADK
jgi:hypothetical protein